MSLIQSMKALLIAVAVGGSSILTAHAGDDYKIKVKLVDKTTGVKIKIKETGSYSLGGWKHVNEVKIKIKGPNGKIKIVANGQDYYPTYTNGYYRLPINQAINSFDLFNVGDVDCLLDGVFMDVVDHAIGSVLGGSFYGAVPSNEIREIMQAVDALAYYVDLAENQQFLQPIKVLAGRALATNYGRGEFSMKTSAAILAMIAQIEFSKDFLEKRMTVSATYDWTVILLGHKERLADMLD